MQVRTTWAPLAAARLQDKERRLTEEIDSLGFPDASELMDDEGEVLEALMQQAVLTADAILSGREFRSTFAEFMQPGLAKAEDMMIETSKPVGDDVYGIERQELPQALLPDAPTAQAIEKALATNVEKAMPVRGMEQAALELQARHLP